MFEKRLATVLPVAFTADGTVNGLVTVADSTSFKVKQKIYLNATGVPTGDYQVKSITDINSIYVGPLVSTPSDPFGGSIDARSDVSAYTVALGATIAADQQTRPNIPEEQVLKAVYDEEPTVSLRTSLVDELGDRYGAGNPLPVSATINVNPGTIPTNWDEIDLSYDVDQNLIGVDYKVPLQPDVVLTLSYDGNGNLTKVVS